MFELKGKYTEAKVFAEGLDENCMGQIVQLINHPAFESPVAIMPDAHYGMGAVIGFTMPLKDKVIPNIIGVDIGCGMLYSCLGRGIFGDKDFADVDHEIRRSIPFGFNIHKDASFYEGDVKAFLLEANRYWKVLHKKFEEQGHAFAMPPYDVEWFKATIKRIDCPENRALNSIGTLGGGNHFIEFCKSDTNDIWLVIHSGSRKFGESVCKHWQKNAKVAQMDLRHAMRQKAIEKAKAEGKEKHLGDIIDEVNASFPQVKGLEFLYTPEQRFGYLHDMLFAQQYAAYNRYTMFTAILKILGMEEPSYGQCVHNFIDPEDLIIRKGAIKATEGETCLVPLHMAAGSLLGVGRGNSEWNNSAPHGAGRTMSRSKAKKRIKLEDFQHQMKQAGVWSSSVCRATLDEAPDAYKDWHTIYDHVSETMEVESHLKPILNLKSVK